MKLLTAAAAGCLSLGIAATARGHFTFLVPSRAAADPGAEVRLSFRHGHPFEHELVAVAPPRRVWSLGPDGSVAEIPLCGRDAAAGSAGGAGRAGAAGPAGRVTDPGGKRRVERGREDGKRRPDGRRGSADAHEHLFCYRIPARGDHLLAAEAEPRIDGDGALVRDFAKVVVHSRSQRAWERPLGLPLEIVPLTRPYALRSGWAFRARVLLEGEALAGALVEAEKVNERPPEEPLPEWEFVTQSARTGPGGVFTVTLDEEGWWVISVAVPTDRREEADGRSRQLVLRSTLSVRTGEPLAQESRE